MLASAAAIILLLVTVAFLGVGVALAFAGIVGAVIATAAERPADVELPAGFAFAVVALLGLLIFALATIAFVPQLS